MRIRGNAFQVHEKYLTLARDAYSSGDRVMAENYFQHAEHYYRIVNATTDPSSLNRMNGNGAHSGYGADDEDGDYEDEFEPQHRHMRPASRPAGDSAPQREGAEPAPEGARADERRGDRVEARGDRNDERGSRDEHRDRNDERGDRSGERRRRNRNFNGRDGERRPRPDGEPQLALDGAEQAVSAPVVTPVPAEAVAARVDGPSADAPSQADAAAPEAVEKPRRRRRRPVAASEDATESSARDGDKSDTAAA